MGSIQSWCTPCRRGRTPCTAPCVSRSSTLRSSPFSSPAPAVAARATATTLLPKSRCESRAGAPRSPSPRRTPEPTNDAPQGPGSVLSDNEAAQNEGGAAGDDEEAPEGSAGADGVGAEEPIPDAGYCGDGVVQSGGVVRRRQRRREETAATQTASFLAVRSTMPSRCSRTIRS